MSKSTVDRLVYMANQIAGFFVTQPGESTALRVADHINAFWVPDMRRVIIAHADAGGEGLSPAALQAVELLKNSSAKSVEKALAAAGENSPGHEPGDDAG